MNGAKLGRQGCQQGRRWLPMKRENLGEMTRAARMVSRRAMLIAVVIGQLWLAPLAGAHPGVNCNSQNRLLQEQRPRDTRFTTGEPPGCQEREHVGRSAGERLQPREHHWSNDGYRKRLRGVGLELGVAMGRDLFHVDLPVFSDSLRCLGASERSCSLPDRRLDSRQRVQRLHDQGFGFRHCLVLRL